MTIRNLATRLSWWVVLAALLSSSAAAQSLTVGLAAGPTSADPHFHALTPNSQFRRHIFDGLVGADAKNRSVPELATAWRKMSDTVWQFDLRPSVVFHDGAPFGPRDVLYSFCRVSNVPNSPGLYKPYTTSIKNMRAVGASIVEIETDGPAPFLPDDLSNIAIVSATAAGVRGDVTFDLGDCGIKDWPATAAFNAAGPVAVGTGPYRLESFTPNTEAALVRWDGYWGARPDHARVTMRFLSNPGARAAALLAGSVDIVEQPPIESLERIRTNPDLRLVETPSANIIYMLFDQALEPSPGVSGTDGRNPFKDVRVRTAVSMAINREAIAARILGGLGRPASQMAGDMIFGFAPGIGAERFDPVEARRLLAEAGYPAGFRLVLATPGGRYLNDVAVAQAIAAMLARIGIDTQVETAPPAVYFTNATNQRYSFFLAGVGANMGEALMLLRVVGHTRTREFGSLNRGRYSNPELDRLIVAGLRAMDDAEREAISRQALAMLATDRGVLPLYAETTVWAMRRGFVYPGRADQTLLAFEVRRDG